MFETLGMGSCCRGRTRGYWQGFYKSLAIILDWIVGGVVLLGIAGFVTHIVLKYRYMLPKSLSPRFLILQLLARGDSPVSDRYRCCDSRRSVGFGCVRYFQMVRHEKRFID